MQNFNKIFIILSLTFAFISCSSTKDLSKLSANEKFEKAKLAYNNKDFDEAVQILQSILIEYPGREIIDSTQYYLALCRYQKEEYLMASYEFSKLIQNMPLSPLVPEAQYMLADCYYRLSPPMPLDQKYTKKAIEEFQAFIDFYPQHKLVKEASEKISILIEKLAYKDYNAAYIYERMENYNAAIFFYSQIIENYHDTKYAPLALVNKIKLEILKKRYDNAKEDIEKFKEKYSSSELLKDILEIEKSLN
ncbi:MAG TPA: outer membrane protein assembly factor BamD [Ignavibacteriales bacterium]|nr:outer membrane protein assembly factor BamD [Ignavibacteriales bacterium]HOL80282.1 outer membrane protein assembly factor BamD [Ignavibacteriales bacterium]HOM64561.1 outer membrane protein assembly factor BamD [Ignavibacteriales bacterium]HPD66658.1 outer membrane protein assembly factor BamD [Ignavibacteriales bacterium]HPP32471.1 outer membrane protein assembly factor BamD [Ignavibacteriales bacterium]